MYEQLTKIVTDFAFTPLPLVLPLNSVIGLDSTGITTSEIFINALEDDRKTLLIVDVADKLLKHGLIVVENHELNFMQKIFNLLKKDWEIMKLYLLALDSSKGFVFEFGLLEVTKEYNTVFFR